MSQYLLSKPSAEFAQRLQNQSLYAGDDAGKTSRPPSDAFLVLDSADRSSSSAAPGSVGVIPSTQPYNNFRLQKPENLVQGGFTRLQLTEVRFPYAIQNVNETNSSFWVVVRGAAADLKAKIDIGVQTASLSGSQIAGEVEALLVANATIGFAALGVTWQCVYLPDPPIGPAFPGGFSIRLQSGAVNGYDFSLFPVEPTLAFPAAPVPSVNPRVKSLLDVMGYATLSNWSYLTNMASNPPPLLLSSKESAYAPLTYTTYIDVVSDKLCYYANVKDGSTKVASNSNIICRLYLADESSTTPTIGQYWNGTNAVAYFTSPPAGSIPFVIHRQFVQPKQFLWNKNTSVDYIDIKLYDDYGNLLYVPIEGLPDFQITFKATED